MVSLGGYATIAAGIEAFSSERTSRDSIESRAGLRRRDHGRGCRASLRRGRSRTIDVLGHVLTRCSGSREGPAPTPAPPSRHGLALRGLPSPGPITQTLTVVAPDRRLVSPELLAASTMIVWPALGQRRRELPVARGVGRHDADHDVAVDDRHQAARGRLAREHARGILRRARGQAAADLEREGRRRGARVTPLVDRDGREVVDPGGDGRRGGGIGVTPGPLAIGVGRAQHGPAEVDLDLVVRTGPSR